MKPSFGQALVTNSDQCDTEAKFSKQLSAENHFKKKKKLASHDSFSLQSHNESNKIWNSWKEKEKDIFWQLSY